MKKTLIALFLLVFFWSGGIYAANETPSGKTADDLLTEARDLLEEDSAGYWSDAELLRHLNHAVRRIVVMTGCLENTERFVLDTGTSEYGLSDSYMAVTSVIYQSGATEFKSLKRGERLGVGYQGGSDAPEYYYSGVSKVGVYPMRDTSDVTVSGNTIYVYYAPLQTTLSSSDSIPTPACYDTAIVDYIVHKGLAKDKMFDASQWWEQRYYQDIQFCTTAVNGPRQEMWHILRPREPQK